MAGASYERMDRGEANFYEQEALHYSKTPRMFYVLGRKRTEKRNLTADEEDEEGDSRPEHIFPELDLPFRLRTGTKTHEFKRSE